MESMVLPVALELAVQVELEALVEQVVKFLIHLAVVVDAEVQAVLEAKLLSHSVVAEKDPEVVLVLMEVQVVLVVVAADLMDSVPAPAEGLLLHSASVLVVEADQADTGTQSWTIDCSRSCSSHGQ